MYDPQGWVDADGWVTLTKCVPGPNRVRLDRQDLPKHELDLVIQPRLNPELVVRLPAAAKAARGR